MRPLPQRKGHDEGRCLGSGISCEHLEVYTAPTGVEIGSYVEAVLARMDASRLSLKQRDVFLLRRAIAA